MTPLEHYATEDKDGNEVGYYGEGVKGYQNARADAEANHLRVICLQFEFSDSEMIDDFTEETDE